MKRRPEPISVTTAASPVVPVWSSGRCGAGSTARIEIRETTENMNVPASASSAKGARSNWTSAPPRPGPPTWEIDSVDCSLLLPASRSSALTRLGRYERYPSSNSTVRQPCTSATVYSTGILRDPVQLRIGTRASTAARPRSAPIINGRLRILSTSTPKNSMGPRKASCVALVIRPTWVAVAFRYSTAVSGSASLVISLPMSETACPSHSLLKSACLADRKSTRLNSSHVEISYAVFCLKKKKKYRIVFLDYIKKQNKHTPR